MKQYFIILFGVIFSCKAQKNITTNLPTDSLQYYSDTCNRYTDYTREYLNDSVYIERLGDAYDTFMLKGNRLFKLHKGAVYKIIDVEEDFNYSEKKYRHYYHGLSPKDTMRRAGEPDVQYSLRLTQSIVIYIPVKVVNIKSREMFMYYAMGDCYPASSPKCIQSKIINGQYGVVYFEKGIGWTGYTAGGTKCNFFLTDKSHKILLQRKGK